MNNRHCVGVGQLTEIRRNAGAIVRVCASIKAGEPFTLPTEKLNIGDKPDEPVDYPRNVRLVHAEKPDDAVEMLLKVMDAVDKDGRWDPKWDCQVVVARNDKGSVSRKALNAKLKAVLNENAATIGRNPFSVGDKIICLRNCIVEEMRIDDYRSAWADELAVRSGVREAGQPAADSARPFGKTDYTSDIRGYLATGETVYVANGEIGKVHAVDEQFAIAQFGGSKGDSDAPFVKLKVRQTKQYEDDEDEGGSSGSSGSDDSNPNDFAYAVTCHKLQGSGVPLVIIIADEQAAQVAGREWWYTAISRGEAACIVIGKMDVIAKQAKVQRLARRKTFLQELIAEKLAVAGQPAPDVLPVADVPTQLEASP